MPKICRLPRHEYGSPGENCTFFGHSSAILLFSDPREQLWPCVNMSSHYHQIEDKHWIIKLSWIQLCCWADCLSAVCQSHSGAFSRAYAADAGYFIRLNQTPLDLRGFGICLVLFLPSFLCLSFLSGWPYWEGVLHTEIIAVPDYVKFTQPGQKEMKGSGWVEERERERQRVEKQQKGSVYVAKGFCL